MTSSEADEGGPQEEGDAFLLYRLLGVERDCTIGEVRKGYLLRARQVHPDKNLDDPRAHESFVKLQRAYSILSDPEQRKRYDDSGGDLTIFEDESDEFREAYQYYRKLYPVLTSEDIDAFAARYRHSEEEMEDLRGFVEEHKGDVSDLLEWIILSTTEDVSRFADYIRTWLSSEKKDFLPAFEASLPKLRRNGKRLAAQSRQEATKARSSPEEDPSLGNLALAIRQKQQKRQGDFLDDLEKKYCKKAGGPNSQSKKRSRNA